MVTTEVVVAVEVAKVVVEESADDLRTESCFSFSHTLFSTHARTLSLSMLVLNRLHDVLKERKKKRKKERKKEKK